MPGDQTQKNVTAINRIVRVVISRFGRITALSVAALGVVSLYPGIQLPQSLALIAGSVGIEAIGSILDRVTSDEKISDDEITLLINQAIQDTKIDQVVTKEDLTNFIDYLTKRLSIQDNREKLILESLSKIEIAIDEKTNDVPSYILLERLDQMQASLDNLHTKFAKDDPKPPPQLKTGSSAVIHLTNATQLSIEMTSDTREFTQELEKGTGSVEWEGLNRKQLSPGQPGGQDTQSNSRDDLCRKMGTNKIMQQPMDIQTTLQRTFQFSIRIGLATEAS